MIEGWLDDDEDDSLDGVDFDTLIEGVKMPDDSDATEVDPAEIAELLRDL